MIFPNLKVEEKLQTNDKTRLDARKTFLSNGDDFVRVEIDPGTGVFYDVTTNKYLDFQYEIDAIYTPVLRVSSEEEASKVFSLPTIEVVAPVDDNLFSSDADLIEYEDDILNYVRDGRNSFLDKHRLSQSVIMDEIERTGIYKSDGSSYSPSEVVNIDEFNQWSTVLTLSLIFNTLSNSSEDIFQQKAQAYNSMSIMKKKRACLRLQIDEDGDNDVDEQITTTTWSGELRRG